MKKSEDKDRPGKKYNIPGMGYYRELLQRILSQGLAREQLAQAIAIGITIGVLPTVWGTSILCFLVAWQMRINQIVVQAANYLVYPLQIALFLPFSSLGRRLVPSRFEGAGTLATDIFSMNWSHLDSKLWDLQMSALFGWSVMALPCLLGAYLITRVSYRVMSKSNVH